MKKGKRVKPKFSLEYLLLIVPKYKETEKKSVTHVALRTVNEFTSFRYEIVVAAELAGRTLRLTIHGLSAPQLTLPSTGPALFQTEFDGLRGKYSVVVSKLDREENSFSVQISPEQVIVEQSPATKFVEIVTREEEFS
jgi:hypothetical protein